MAVSKRKEKRQPKVAVSQRKKVRAKKPATNKVASVSPDVKTGELYVFCDAYNKKAPLCIEWQAYDDFDMECEDHRKRFYPGKLLILHNIDMSTDEAMEAIAEFKASKGQWVHGNWFVPTKKLVSKLFPVEVLSVCWS